MRIATVLMTILVMATAAPMAMADPSDRNDAREDSREGKQDARQEGRDGKQDAR